MYHHEFTSLMRPIPPCWSHPSTVLEDLSHTTSAPTRGDGGVRVHIVRQAERHAGLPLSHGRGSREPVYDRAASGRIYARFTKTSRSNRRSVQNREPASPVATAPDPGCASSHRRLGPFRDLVRRPSRAPAPSRGPARRAAARRAARRAYSGTSSCHVPTGQPATPSAPPTWQPSPMAPASSKRNSRPSGNAGQRDARPPCWVAVPTAITPPSRPHLRRGLYPDRLADDLEWELTDSGRSSSCCSTQSQSTRFATNGSSTCHARPRTATMNRCPPPPSASRPHRTRRRRRPERTSRFPTAP